MALLGSCWFITQSILIPDGLLKWFYLSFYIHPIFLLLCQIFLWIKSLQKLLQVLCSFLVRTISIVVGSCFHYFFKYWVFFPLQWLYSFTLVGSHVVNEGKEEVETFDQNLQIISNKYQINVTSLYIYCSSVVFISYGVTINEMPYKEENIVEVDHHQIQKRSMLESYSNETNLLIKDDDDKDTYSNGTNVLFENDDQASQKDKKQKRSTEDCDGNSNEVGMISMSSSMNSSQAVDKVVLDLNQFSSSLDVSSSKIISVVVVEEEVDSGGWMIKKEDDEGDEYLNKYTKTMRWFDVLNQERTCGISAILNEQEGSSSILLIEGMKAVNLSSPIDMFGSKMGRKNVLKSLEIDFELVYVGQSCLSWEALHHQCRKVEALISSSCSLTQKGTFFHKSVAAEFQQFQVLLERFVEDERCEGKRVWNYVRRRFSNKTLLQVPNVLEGYLEQKKEGMVEEAINVEVVLRAIEKCIQAFWVFVKTDKKKAQWKMRSSIWTTQNPPPLEDPRDFQLLANISTKLQQKELYLKDSQGKQKCWVRKVVNPIEDESQRKEILFAMIDMKLVSRVLHMSLLSSSQLRWCQDKLDNIDFKEGKIIRPCMTGPLFPS